MSKLSITLQFDSEAEAFAFLHRTTHTAPEPVAPPAEKEKQAKPKITSKVTAPAAPTPPAATNTTVAPAGTPPMNTQDGVPAPSAPLAAVVPSPAKPVVLTLDNVRTALRTVFNKPGGTGALAATALLKKYNATSVSQVKPEDYASFIKDCT